MERLTRITYPRTVSGAENLHHQHYHQHAANAGSILSERREQSKQRAMKFRTNKERMIRTFHAAESPRLGESVDRGRPHCLYISITAVQY